MKCLFSEVSTYIISFNDLYHKCLKIWVVLIHGWHAINDDKNLNSYVLKKISTKSDFIVNYIVNISFLN